MADLNLNVEKPVVLVIDDQPFVRAYLSALMEDIAIVEEVDSGEDGIEAANLLSPDLILLDVEMPGISGYEVCERIKANPDTTAIPIIFITGRENAEDEERGLVLGGVDYIKKPLTPGLVRARINNQLRLLRYQRDLERLATTDQLTELWNRRYMLEVAESELARFKRYGHGFSIVMFDIDHFKALNDTHGHAAGDLALRNCAETLKDAIRSGDTLARVGGEEFCIILPDTGIGGAQAMAEKIRLTVENIETEFDDTTIRFTVSIGVTAVRTEDGSFDEILARVDDALYDAKKAGRNRIVAKP